MSYSASVSGGSIRKRPRQASDFPSGIPEFEGQVGWGCHPMYDTMVHFSCCGVCHAYLNHLVEAEHDSSFQNAIKVRDRLRDAYFHDGVSEGRRRQRDDDDYVYQDRERYRKERNDALEAISRYRIESHDSREVLQMVTEHLRASQTDCDSLRQRIETLNKENSDLANRLQANHTISHDFVGGTTKPEISPTPSPSIPEPQRAVTSYASVLVASTAANTTSVNGQRVVHLPARSADSAVSPKPPTASAPPAQSGFPHNPKNIRQLQTLMTAAHQPGNEAALSRIKVLCSEAHATPREQKTDIQRVLLSSWRSPMPGGAPPSVSAPIPPFRAPARSGNYSSAPPIKVNPRVDDPVEVWYEYLCTHQASWPRGVRRDARNRPVLVDLKASRIVARLRPEADLSGSTAPRAEFMACVAELFSAPGAYRNRVETHNFKVAPAMTIRPYRGPATVAVEDVVRHFADCGVTFDAATQELEPWAQNYQASGPHL